MSSFTSNANANSPNVLDSLKLLQQKNIELSDELSKLRNEVEYTKSLVQVGNGTVSNQLSSSQHNLNTLNILLIFLSLHYSQIYKRDLIL